MQGAKIFQVDAFASEPFRGNPAGVVVFPDGEPWPEDAWLQSFAAEMNLSETAFLRRLSADNFDLRWCTPAVEVDLCGHATFGSAHILWSELGADPEAPLRFQSRSGELAAKRNGSQIELDFPAKPAVEKEAPDGLLESLGIDDPIAVAVGDFDWLVEVASEKDVLNVSPDFVALGEIETRGVIVTSVANPDSDYDFISRFFAPAAGINEDPVTGSAHTCLSPYWSPRLGSKLTGFQASPRGGMVSVELVGDRVLLGGASITVFRGELA